MPSLQAANESWPVLKAPCVFPKVQDSAGQGSPLSTQTWPADAPRTHPVLGTSPPRGRRRVGDRRGWLCLHHPRAPAAPPPHRLHRASGSSRLGGGLARRERAETSGLLAPPAPGANEGNLSSASQAPAQGTPQARVGGSRAAGAGRGRGGSRRRNHKAVSPGGRGHSHKPTLSRPVEKAFLPRAQSSKTSRPPRIFPARRNSRHHGWGN